MLPSAASSSPSPRSSRAHRGGSPAVRIEARRPGRLSGEERVVLVDSAGEKAAEGLIFWGRRARGLRPWADLVVSDTSILPDLARMLGPGASLMVAYGEDDTEWALRRKVPPQATPLGLALLEAGCRWFKDWYFPEGGMEGGTKLQGTIPLDDGRRRELAGKLLEELDGWRHGNFGGAERVSVWADRARELLVAEVEVKE